MHDQGICRCIEASCAKPLPRRVNYCPYCGTAQQASGQAHAGPAQPEIHAGPAGAAPDPPPPAGSRIQRPATLSARPARADPGPAALAPEWGASGAARPTPSGPAAAPRASTGAAASRPAAPSRAPQRPPQREPIRLRWWLLALVGLWVVWFMARPSPKKLATRIDHAIALAAECRPREAQSELIALRATRATQEQLQRVQDALNAAAAECRRPRQRSKSLGDSGRRAHRLATDEP